MRQAKLLFALSLIAVTTPAWPSRADRTAAAPAGAPDTRYCMRVEATTGSRIEQVRCWTRDGWAEQGVDLDKDWPKEGVRVVG